MGFKQPERDWLESSPLGSRIPTSAKCRYVLTLVNKLDLDPLYASYSAQGGDAFDPATMLATWFLAYSDGLTSTRQLELQCQRDLHYIYISGNLCPDHTSLSRFRQRHLELMKGYFAELVRMAGPYSAFKRIAVDGSVIQARASKKKNKDQDGLESYERATAYQIASYLAQSEAQDKLGPLQAKQVMLAERSRQLSERKQTLKPEHRARHQINLSEPDAINHSGCPGYNVQASVDMETHLIVSCDVVTDRNDRQQCTRQYEQTEAILGSDKEREYTLDSGYHSLETLQWIEDNSVDVLLADPDRRSSTEQASLKSEDELLARNKPLHRGDFVYDPEADCYHCPGGDELLLWRQGRQHGRAASTYRARACPQCGLQHLCLSKRNKSGIRNITRDQSEWLAEQMAQRLSGEEARERMKGRRESVEPVFGNLKSNMGFARFRLSSLAKVRGEFAMMCIGHNINKLFKLAAELLCFIIDALMFKNRIRMVRLRCRA